MKQIRWAELGDYRDETILSRILPGENIYKGGVSFGLPGQRSHSNDGPDGRDWHVHDEHEVFLVLQGKGWLEVNQESLPVMTGDVFVIEPGEDHHLISDQVTPLVVVYIHTHTTFKREGSK